MGHWRLAFCMLWLAIGLLTLTGCAYTQADFACRDGSRGSLMTARLFVGAEASAPICQPGTATVSSDPSAGAAVVTTLVGALVRLAAPEVP